MHFSKASLVICAVALGTALATRAEDTPAQAAARAAMVSKLFELSAQDATNNPPPAAPAPAPKEEPVQVITAPPATEPAAPAAAAPAETPAAPTAPVAETPAKPADEPAMKPVDNEDKEKAAAEKEMAKQATAIKASEDAAAKAQAKADAEKAAAEAKAQKAAAKKAEKEKAAEIAAAKKQLKENMEQPQPAAMPSAPTSSTDNPAQAKAREALAKSLFETSDATPVVTASPGAPVPAPMPVIVAAPAPAPQTISVSPVIAAPPLPISAEKQQKLHELLAKYQADQITPDEYQKQRAAILAGQ